MSTELSTIEYLRSKIISLADHIRAKAGKSGAMTFAELEAAVDGISTGSSGGGGSTGGDSTGGSGTATIEGGYTINFYDHNKNFIESHSTKCGYYIDKPLSYDAETWQNADGYVNSFPLTVPLNSETKVFDMYAGGNITCEQQLYNHYGVDFSEYPYLVIIQRWSSSDAKWLCFAKSCTHNTSSESYTLTLGNVLYASTEVISSNYSSNEEAVELTKVLITNLPSLSEEQESITIGNVGASRSYYDACVCHTNNSDWVKSTGMLTLRNLDAIYTG